MYHGHYFRLDTDIANIEKGIAVFRYCPDGRTDSDIYVTFSDDEIEFCIIGEDAEGNATILHVPVDDNIERNFAETVTQAFHWNVEDADIPPQEISHLSYFSTFYFGSNSKHLAYWNKPRMGGSVHGSFSIPKPLLVRKLILDFLFDLRETTIFQMSPHYGELMEKLRQNFFARCLLAKARYWYQRAMCAESMKEDRRIAGGNGRKEWEEKKQFYGGILFEAEKEWADCIRDSRADKTFHEEFYDWFDDCETEMKRIYRPYLSIRPNEGILRDIRKEHNENVSKWFVARYAGLTSWRVLLSGHGSFFGMHLFLPRLLFAIITAWFTLVLVEGMKPIEILPENRSVFPFIVLILTMIYAVSLIVVRKVVPFAKYVFVRALKLSGLVLMISFFAGNLLLLTTGTLGHGNLVRNFSIMLISAAFVGLVLQIFLQGDNPSESL